MKSKKLHDPFHDDAPQVGNVYQYQQPPDDVSVDAPGGGTNVPHRIVEDNPIRHFKKEPEHTKEYDYSKGKK